MRMALAEERRRVRRRVLIGGMIGPMMICMVILLEGCEKRKRAWREEGRMARESFERNVQWRSIGSPISDRNGPPACDMRRVGEK